MAYNKYHMTKAHYINSKHDLPASILDTDYRTHNTSIESRSYGQLSKLLRGIFRIFSSEDAYMDVGGRTASGTSRRGNNENSDVKNSAEIKDNETQSLLDLENCANAARETEACGQYDWIKSSDE